MLYEYISICRNKFESNNVWFLTLRLENALIVNKQMNGLGDNNV